LETDPVSPELVLIDPGLGERERARLREKARFAELIDISTLRQRMEARVVRPQPAPRPARWRTAVDFSRTRLLPAALLCSLLANGLLAAHFLAREKQGSRVGVPVAVRPATPVQQRTARTIPRTHSRRSRHLAATKAAVERKLVALLVQAPPGKLPRAFVDPTTGLVKNNMQVVCRRSKQRSFLCSARVPTDGARQALFVRYRRARNGTDIFRWYGYRRGSRRIVETFAQKG
jgi:hypothetical protein